MQEAGGSNPPVSILEILMSEKMRKIFLLIVFIVFCFVFLFFIEQRKEITYKDFDSETIIEFPKCGKKIFFKIADESIEQQIGFSKATNIANDEGILFLFDSEQKRNFWMKDVNFDLDIIFLDKEGRVLEFFTMERCLEEKCKIYSTTYPIKYALEVKKDIIKNCIARGDKIEID